MHTTKLFAEGNRAFEIFRLLLLEGREMTSLEIAERLRMTCVSTFVSEARQVLERRGAGTIVSRYMGRSKDGRKIWGYRFVARKEGAIA